MERHVNWAIAVTCGLPLILSNVLCGRLRQGDIPTEGQSISGGTDGCGQVSDGPGSDMTYGEWDSM